MKTLANIQVEIITSSKYTPGRPHGAPNRICIHTAESPIFIGVARNIANYLVTANVNASTHFTMDPCVCVQSVSTEDIAWHAGATHPFDPNNRSIGIEHAGYAHFTEEQWAAPEALAMLDRSAALIYELCKQFDIAPKWLLDSEMPDESISGIFGHDQVTHVFKSGTHWDPGPHFPRAQLIQRVLLLRGETPVEQP